MFLVLGVQKSYVCLSLFVFMIFFFHLHLALGYFFLIYFFFYLEFSHSPFLDFLGCFNNVFLFFFIWTSTFVHLLRSYILNTSSLFLLCLTFNICASLTFSLLSV